MTHEMTTLHSRLSVLLGCVGTGVAAFAQSGAPIPMYSIQRIGLYGPGYRDALGAEMVMPFLIYPDGRAIGTSQPSINGTLRGQDLWIWNGTTTRRVGLTGGEYSFPDGSRWSDLRGTSKDSPYTTGISWRVGPNGANLGLDAWADNGATTLRINPIGPEYTGSSGFRSAAILGDLPGFPGQLIGTATRIVGQSTPFGSDLWLWNGAETRVISPSHGNSPGFSTNEVWEYKPDGSFVGRERRYLDDSTDNGQVPWVWNGTNTVSLGLAGPEYTGSLGYRYSDYGSVEPLFAAGSSSLISGERSITGADAWVWDGAQTVKVGPVGPEYISPSGYKESHAFARDPHGRLLGKSLRYWGGVGRWEAWTLDGGAYTPIGLMGSPYVGGSGIRSSDLRTFDKTSRRAIGLSARFTGLSTTIGYDAWVWDGATSTAIGLAPTVGSSLRYYNDIRRVTPSGYVVGIAGRDVQNVSDGQDVWVWTGTATVQLGLLGPAYTGSQGYRSSDIAQVRDDLVLGKSYRITGVNGINGTDLWAWSADGLSQIGLAGAEFTGPDGYQESGLLDSALFVGPFIYGYSRINPSPNPPSYDTAPWVWDGHTTTRLGLTGPAHTPSSGGTFSTVEHTLPSGVCTGYSKRFASASPAGQDAWYYDPTTRTCHDICETIAGHVRPDGYAFSSIGTVNSEGFAQCTCRIYQGGSGAIVTYLSFLFRPDTGVVLLNDHIAGGLALSGWADSINVDISPLPGSLIGTGNERSSTPRGNAAFVMLPTLNPCPIDIGEAGGLSGFDGRLDNNDFIVFIDAFFQRSQIADVAGRNGLSIPDGEWGNDDFVAYIDRFFTGCP
jgi:hypothetical protein